MWTIAAALVAMTGYVGYKFEIALDTVSHKTVETVSIPRG